jgi:hypothetical protein
MSENQIEQATWDGTAIVGWLSIGGEKIKVLADRDTIHRHAPGFNDALTWEIKRHAVEMYEKLRPFFLSHHT